MREIKFTFRFAIDKINDHQVAIRRGTNGPGVISPEFIKFQNLTPEEVEKADEAAIRAIALVEE